MQAQQNHGTPGLQAAHGLPPDLAKMSRTLQTPAHQPKLPTSYDFAGAATSPGLQPPPAKGRRARTTITQAADAAGKLSVPSSAGAPYGCEGSSYIQPPRRTSHLYSTANACPFDRADAARPPAPPARAPCFSLYAFLYLPTPCLNYMLWHDCPQAQASLSRNEALQDWQGWEGHPRCTCQVVQACGRGSLGVQQGDV